MTDIQEKLEAFNKRWAIVENSTYEEEFEKFRIRVFNVLKGIDYLLPYESIRKFCTVTGVPLNGDVVFHTLVNEKDEKRFYRLVQIIFCLTFKEPHRLKEKQSGFIDAIKYSKVNLTAAIQGEELILYPRGEKELDAKLVNEVLNFLNEDSQKHFIEALKYYENSTESDAVKSAESLRRSLEEFLRFKLANQQGLAANTKELTGRLKADGRDPIIRGIITQIFSYLDQYFNENSKHKDGDIDEAENEYLIYQVGLLMRYVNNVIPVPLT